LHGRVGDDRVSADRIPLDPRVDEDTICISYNLVVFNDVAGVDGRRQANPKIKTLGRVSISYQPVRTEPVMACACQSYAAAGSSEGPVPY
jgi:hypothetical protein